MQLGTHKCKIIEYAAHLLLIFRSNVGLAKQHERIDVITGIEKQTTDSRVGYFIFYQSNGTHVQLDHFLHKLHLLIHRQFHTTEYSRYHFSTYIIVVMECPAQFGIVPFGYRFVVEYRCPTQPQVVALG